MWLPRQRDVDGLWWRRWERFSAQTAGGDRQGPSLARLGQDLSGLVDRSNAEGGVRKGVAGPAIVLGRC